MVARKVHMRLFAPSRLRVALALVTGVALLTTAQAGAARAPRTPTAPSGATVAVTGIGRATELDLLGRGPTGIEVLAQAGSKPLIGYGIAASLSNTVDLSRYGLATRASKSRGAGMVALYRNSRGELWLETEPARSGTRSTLGYVYPATAGERLLPVSSASTSTDPTVVASNLNAGGAVWSWTYRGVQYVNDYDYGRQIQSALWQQVGTKVYNPNEAGDEWSSPNQATIRHGSPLASGSTSGATHSTRSIPLEWDPAKVTTAAEAFAPVVWQDVRLGKDLTLDYGGMPGVAQYRTVLQVPNSFSGHLEMPTTYLRGEFDTYWGVDAASGELTALPAPAMDLNTLTAAKIDYRPASGKGGVVASTPDGQHAMGIYGVMTSAGGAVSEFAVHNFVPIEDHQAIPGFGTGRGDFSTAKLRAMYAGTFRSGVNTFETFIVTGTVEEVVTKMQWLAGG